MDPKKIAAGVVALIAAAWFFRDEAPFAGALRAAGVSTSTAALPGLKSSGVHKCAGASGTVYQDAPCPRGSRELASDGGTVTVMPFERPKVEAPASSGPLGGPLLKPIDPAERDRMRDKMIDDAANRP